MYKHIDIFTGIGGWPLGLQRAFGSEYQAVAFCEKDKFCCKVLTKHWPNVPIIEDVFDMKGDIYDAIDILSCSPPCQPYSVAGKRRGSGDNRALWPEVIRILREMSIKPRWVCIENVPGLLTIEQGLAFEQVLTNLEGEGYAVGTVCVPACAVDAPHRRQRVWIVAHAEGQGRRLQPECEAREWRRSWPGGGGEDVPDAARDGQPRLGVSIQPWRSQQTSIDADGCNSERRESSYWSSESGLGRMVDGLSDRLERRRQRERIRVLGNAIVPQIAEIIGKTILMIEESRYNV